LDSLLYLFDNNDNMFVIIHFTRTNIRLEILSRNICHTYYNDISIKSYYKVVLRLISNFFISMLKCTTKSVGTLNVKRSKTLNILPATILWLLNIKQIIPHNSAYPSVAVIKIFHLQSLNNFKTIQAFSGLVAL